MDIVHFTKWSSFEKYGINCLTGESCAYGMRLLCDLNEDGVKLLNDFFGIESTYAQPWNTSVNGKDAIASIMLPKDLYHTLARFISTHILNKKYCVVTQNEVVCTDDEEVFEKWKEYYPDSRGYVNYTMKNSINGRCIHQMSGRTI